jgi:hypothetical protein
MTVHLDIIGDIHGHAGKLLELLAKLGYKEEGGCFRQPGRTAIFLGDLIDRGAQNFRTIEIVRAMVEHRQAAIVMGNHEYNALCYHTIDDKGNYLRKHSEKNMRQHEAVLHEIADGGARSEAQWLDHLEWFKTMPLFLEIAGIRIVHACWDAQAIEFMKKIPPPLTRDFLIKYAKKGTREFAVVETLLKGKEIELPGSHPGVMDKDGNRRRQVRLKWWLTPWWEKEEPATYDQVTRIDEKYLSELAKIQIPDEILESIKTAMKAGLEDERPVFFGHYWFTGAPRLVTKQAACLDYSVGKGGKLVCYRWDGETILDEEKFIYV